MLSYEQALKLIQDSLSSLYQSGLVEQDVIAHVDTVLLGTGTFLDSIAFVTFVTDLEDRLNRNIGREIFLVLSDIHDYNADKPYLSAGTLAKYIVHLTTEQSL